MYTMAFFLAFYLASILTFSLTFQHSIWHLFWHSFWHLFWHSSLQFHLTFYSGIYSGHSAILSDILFRHLFNLFWHSILPFYLLSDILFWQSIWHSNRYLIYSDILLHGHWRISTASTRSQWTGSPATRPHKALAAETASQEPPP